MSNLINGIDIISSNAVIVKTDLLAPDKVYPTLAAGVQVVAGTASWVLGVEVEIIPANLIPEDFTLRYVHLETVSATTVYELVLYAGTSQDNVEISRTRFTSENTKPIRGPLIVKNTRIFARLASASKKEDSVIITLGYTNC